MGSIANAAYLGFLCRVCMNTHRHVILLFGDRGIKMQLVEKLAKYLHIHVTPGDKKPRVLCIVCVEKLLKIEQEELNAEGNEPPPPIASYASNLQDDALNSSNQDVSPLNLTHNPSIAPDPQDLALPPARRGNED